jgi:hypothetical protein
MGPVRTRAQFPDENSSLGCSEFESSETRNKMRPGPDVISDDDNSRLGLSIPGSRGRHSDLYGGR